VTALLAIFFRIAKEQENGSPTLFLRRWSLHILPTSWQLDDEGLRRTLISCNDQQVFCGVNLLIECLVSHGLSSYYRAIAIQIASLSYITQLTALYVLRPTWPETRALRVGSMGFFADLLFASLALSFVSLGFVAYTVYIYPALETWMMRKTTHAATRSLESCNNSRYRPLAEYHSFPGSKSSIHLSLKLKTISMVSLLLRACTCRLSLWEVSMLFPTLRSVTM
jgi:hypothetical protein